MNVLMVVEKQCIYAGFCIALQLARTDVEIITVTDITSAHQKLYDRNEQFDVLVIEDTLPPGDNPAPIASDTSDLNRGIAFLRSFEPRDKPPVERVVFVDTTNQFNERDGDKLSEDLGIKVLVLEMPFETTDFVNAVLYGELE